MTWQRVLLLGALPLLLLAAYLRVQFSVAGQQDALRQDATELGQPSSCTPASTRGRTVILVVDSLARDIARDRDVMPHLNALLPQAASGEVQPCLSQLSLLCMRTIFEGTEPLLATGLQNFSGTDALGPSLVRRWAENGRHVAAVGDDAFVRTYRPALYAATTFASDVDRDAFGRAQTMAWLADPSIDTILSLVIDTDAVSHRYGINAPEYRAKFAEADAFIGDVVARLNPADTLLVTGDHGHDALGYHSTGIFAPTVYVARGPGFVPGATADIDMATLRFLLGAVTCEGLDSGYQGQIVLAPLRLSEADQQMWATLAANMASATGPSTTANKPWWVGLSWLALLVVGTILATAPQNRPRWFGAGLGIAMTPAMFAPTPAWPWAAATIAVGALGLRLRSLPWPERTALAWPAAAVALTQLVIGATAGTILVTLQNQVNVPWMIGFWLCLWGLIALGTSLLHRRWNFPRLPAIVWASFAIVFYGLYLGPYYYGTARNLPLVLCMLWLATGEDSAIPRWSPRWFGGVALPLLPIGFPEMKEWALRYPLIDGWLDAFASVSPSAAAGLIVGIAFVIAAVLAPQRQAVGRLAVVCAMAFVVGSLTRLTPSAIVATVLVILSRYAFATSIPARASATWLRAAADAGYCFMVYFVAFHGLRFANVDFAFAFDVVPMSWGEGAAAAIAVPLCVIKYCSPIVLLLLSTPRAPDARTLSLVLLKLIALVASFVGMALVASRSTELFSHLLAQEIALSLFLYVSVGGVILARTSRSHP